MKLNIVRGVRMSREFRLRRLRRRPGLR